MAKVKMINARTGEITEFDDFRNEPGKSEIMRMSYKERAEIYMNDRSRYEYLMSKIASEPKKTPRICIKPINLWGGLNSIIGKED